MDGLISRQAAIDAVGNALDRETILNRLVRNIAINALKRLPSAQPERKVGKWIKPNNQVAVAQDEWICSSCNYLVLHRHKFCPNCGAKMEG